MSDDTLLAEIIELAKAHTGAKAVGSDTRLYADLGMTGDDAQAFMLAFAVKYDVDLGDLIWLRYFDDESSMADLLEPALAMTASLISPSFAARWDAAQDAEREVTIAHLADVARAKAWRHPGDAFKRPPVQSPMMLAFSAISALAMAFFVAAGGVVAFTLITGEIGQQNPLPLIGVIAMSVVPIFFAYTSWRAVERKLASAEG